MATTRQCKVGNSMASDYYEHAAECPECGAYEAARQAAALGTPTPAATPAPAYDFALEAGMVCEAIGSDNGNMTVQCALREAFEAGRATPASGDVPDLVLSERDQEALRQAIENPPEPNAALRALFASGDVPPLVTRLHALELAARAHELDDRLMCQSEDSDLGNCDERGEARKDWCIVCTAAGLADALTAPATGAPDARPEIEPGDWVLDDEAEVFLVRDVITHSDGVMAAWISSACWLTWDDIAEVRKANGVIWRRADGGH